MSIVPQIYKAVVSPGIVEIRSNVKSIPGFDILLEQGNEHTLDSETPPKVCITFLVKNDLPFKQVKNKEMRFGCITGKLEGDSLYYERPLLNLGKVKMEIARLRDSPVITINRLYSRIKQLAISDFQPAGQHIQDTLLVKLLMQNYLALHGAAFSTLDKKGILIIGLPGVGKTKVLIQALRHGFQFLADDLVIADSNSYLYPCPSISTLNYKLQEILDRPHSAGFLREKWLNFLHSKIPLLKLFWEPPYISISSIVPKVEVASQAKINSIFILARGSKQVVKLGSLEALRMLLSLNRLEFSYYQNPILLTYSLLNPWLNLPEFVQLEEGLLQELVNHSDCFLCVAPESGEFFNLIQNHLS